MKTRLQEALENMKRYNAGVMCRECFGFEPGIPYDALVVATGRKPGKTIPDPSLAGRDPLRITAAPGAGPSRT